MTRYLVASLLIHNVDAYLPLFNYFMKSLTQSNRFYYNIDHLIITDSSDLKLNWKTCFANTYIHIVDKDASLKNALLHKLDIVNFDKLLTYNKILYLDVDFIIHGDLQDIFRLRVPKNRLVATEEGVIDGQFWTLDLYTQQELKELKRARVKSFNSGIFMFRPSIDLIHHFKECHRIGLNHNGSHFYDQSYFNYYFNVHKISLCSQSFEDLYVMVKAWEKKKPNLKEIVKDTIMLYHVGGFNNPENKLKWMKKMLHRIKN